MEDDVALDWKSHRPCAKTKSHVTSKSQSGFGRQVAPKPRIASTSNRIGMQITVGPWFLPSTHRYCTTIGSCGAKIRVHLGHRAARSFRAAPIVDRSAMC